MPIIAVGTGSPVGRTPKAEFSSTHSTAALAQEQQAEEDGVLKTVYRLFVRQFWNLADMLHSRGEPESERLRDQEVQRGQQQEYFQIRDRAYQPRIGD